MGDTYELQVTINNLMRRLSVLEKMLDIHVQTEITLCYFEDTYSNIIYKLINSHKNISIAYKEYSGEYGKDLHIIIDGHDINVTYMMPDNIYNYCSNIIKMILNRDLSIPLMLKFAENIIVSIATPHIKNKSQISRDGTKLYTDYDLSDEFGHICIVRTYVMDSVTYITTKRIDDEYEEPILLYRLENDVVADQKSIESLMSHITAHYNKLRTICDFLYAQLGGIRTTYNIFKIDIYIIAINDSCISVAESYRPRNKCKIFNFDECDKVVAFLTDKKHKDKFT